MTSEHGPSTEIANGRVARRPLGIPALSVAHFTFALVPLVWLLLTSLDLSCTGHQSGSCAVASGSVVLGPIFNAAVAIPLGYGLWKGANLARVLVMMFAVLWIMMGAFFLLSFSYFTAPMLAYGVTTLYYMTRPGIKSHFQQPTRMRK